MFFGVRVGFEYYFQNTSSMPDLLTPILLFFSIGIYWLASSNASTPPTLPPLQMFVLLFFTYIKPSFEFD